MGPRSESVPLSSTSPSRQGNPVSGNILEERCPAVAISSYQMEVMPACKVLDIAVTLSSGSERELLSRFRRGETAAFTAPYRDHAPAVFRFAWHMTGDRCKAAEITQEVFVWLLRHSEKFNSERGNLAAFLAGVARKCVRRQQRFERRWLPFQQIPGGQASTAFDPNRAMDAESLRKAIALLPLRYREVVVLCNLEGHTYEQVASLLNCAVGTVCSRLHRAHQLLARKFHRRGNP